jgi:hypothetical protein
MKNCLACQLNIDPKMCSVMCRCLPSGEVADLLFSGRGVYWKQLRSNRFMKPEKLKINSQF